VRGTEPLTPDVVEIPRRGAHPLPFLAVDLVAASAVQAATETRPSLERRQLLLEALSRYRQAAKRLQAPTNEAQFQDQLWLLIKSIFPDASEETNTDEFAGVRNRPDFKVPSARLVIDAKFVKEDADRARLRGLREELADKAVSYLRPDGDWRDLIIVMYDAKDFLRKYPELLADFNRLPGVTVVEAQ